MLKRAIRTALLGSGFLALAAVAADDATTLPKIRATAEILEDYKADEATALKTATPLRDVPQSISVVTRQRSTI